MTTRQPRSSNPRTPSAAASGVAGNAPAAQRSGVGVLGRERLLARLATARRLRCIVITGPAGSGKSTLIASWRQALVPLGFDVAWLTASVDANAPARFVDALVASLAQVSPDLVTEAAQLRSVDADPDAMERFAISLVRRIALHPRELMLVVDDLHHLTDPAILEALQWLLDYAPPNLHVVLASRGAPRLSLDRLRGQSQTLEFGHRDLRFTQPEAGEFLKAHAPDIDARSIKTLHDLSDGWIAGLRMLALDWKKGRKAPAYDTQGFDKYFEQEVLSLLSADERATLVRLAICSRFCASLCAALLDRSDALGHATALLARLEADDLFISPIEGHPPEAWYRLHPLLRNALLAQFAALDDATRQAVHARAFAWFRERGMLEDAVRHAVQSGEPARAAQLVDQCAPSLIMRGERNELIALLRHLPAERIAGSLRMRLWAARCQLFQRDLHTCEATLASIARDAPPQDTALHFHVAMVRAALAVQRDDLSAALAMLPQLLDPPPDAEPLAMGGRNNILSWLYTQQGEYEKARQVQADAAPLTVDGVPLVATAAGSLHGRCLVGMSYALEGRMTQAERIYRAVAAEAEQGGKAFIDSYYLAIGLLADVLYELNDARQARMLLDSKTDIIERIAIPDAVLRVHRLLASAHWQDGNRQEAFAHALRLEDYAIKRGVDRLLAHSLTDQIHYRLLVGEMMAAEAALARLEAIHASHQGGNSHVSGEVHELLQRSRIRFAVSMGDLDGAAAQLTTLIEQCEARGRQRSVAHLLVRSAGVDARLGRHACALRKLVDALERGHRLGLLRSLVDADSQSLDMVGELLRSGELDPVLAFYAERLMAARTDAGRGAAKAAEPARAAPAGAQEAFNEREVEMLRLLAQALPNKKIARALGLSPETVKWYLSRIYGKLRVSGRDEAVARIRDLGWDVDMPSAPPA